MNYMSTYIYEYRIIETHTWRSFSALYFLFFSSSFLYIIFIVGIGTLVEVSYTMRIYIIYMGIPSNGY